jgi:hypothetical protein
MKPTFRLLCVIALLTIFAHGLPAPTVAETTPTPAKSAAPRKATKTKRKIDSVFLKNCPLKKGDPLSKVKEFYGVSYDPQKSDPPTPSGIYYTYHFAKYGVYVFFDNFLQVATLRFDRPFSGKIDGVSVGDTKDEVVKLKGEPPTRFESPDLNNVHLGARLSLNEAWVYKGEGELLRYDLGSVSGKVQTILSTNGTGETKR